MRKALLTTVAVIALATGGFALAGVDVSGPSNGTVTVGQRLVIAVNDSLDASAAGYAHYLCTDPDAVAGASGRFGVGPLGGAEGGTGWIPLSVSCTNPGTWNYSGSVTLTVPADVGSGEWVSVVVTESLPNTSYNFNQTYPVVTPASTTTPTPTNTVGTSTSGTTTTVGTSNSGTMTTVGTTVTVPAGTTTISVPVTTTTVVTAPPPAPTTTVAPVIVLTVPSTITIQQANGFIYITITTNDKRSLQTLCWHSVRTNTQRCEAGSGSWRIKIRKASGKQIFVLKKNGEVVARKSVTIRLKR